ncbi:MAG: site-specific integrase [Candidatus Melainabacteria bacterium]|nr:site-specific integrase [Candidatus Melainabacteria bacterium]
MKEIIEQFINQILEDQKFSLNTKAAYKSDLNEFLEYVVSTNTQLQDINQGWVKSYLKHLEETNKEQNSFNRRASTFRLFLRYLYIHKLIPANYSLIVTNQATFFKTEENELEKNDIKKIIEDTKLRIDQRLILLLIGKLGLSATQIARVNTFQVDFENKVIDLSDTEKIYLPHEIFTLLREYLLEVRANLASSSNCLSLFLNEKGKPISEIDIYGLIKKLSEDLNLQGKLTIRSLKKLSADKIDTMSMQREIFNA